MGGQSKTTAQSSNKTEPWAPAVPAIESLLGKVGSINTSLTPTQTGAFDQLQTSANQGNHYAPAIGNYASTMLAGGGPDRTGMVNDAYTRYQDQLRGTAAGDYLNPNTNPWYSQVTDTIGKDVQNRLSGMYAGAGRDPSGAGSFGQNLGRGIAEGVAPVFGQQYQFERGQQGAAQAALYGAGNTTGSILSGLDQTRLANMGTGVGAADQATQAANYGPMQTLMIEGQKAGYPLSILQQLAGILTPIAGLGGQSTGTQSGTQQMSGAQQFALIAGGLGSLFRPPAPAGGSIGGGGAGE